MLYKNIILFCSPSLKHQKRSLPSIRPYSHPHTICILPSIQSTHHSLHAIQISWHHFALLIHSYIMHYLSLHLLVTSLILSFSLASTTTTSINPATTLKPKTSHLTCSQIYCGSSITCSDSGSSEFRYDPTLGESCCFLNQGFCLDGNFCENVSPIYQLIISYKGKTPKFAGD